jgi:hypothetical protein
MKISATVAVLAVVALAAGVAIAAKARDGVVIHNTGSTNFVGYTIKLRSDGTATVVRANRAGEAIGAPSTGTVPMDIVRKFFDDLKAAKKSGNAVGRSCMKSASFGSATVVQYHGWTSPDLECPGEGFVGSLAAQAHQIAAALQVQSMPMRRPLMPNEPRRPETGPAQASPTPESSPPAP